jgi:hypothetical protein
MKSKNKHFILLIVVYKNSSNRIEEDTLVVRYFNSVLFHNHSNTAFNKLYNNTANTPSILIWVVCILLRV